MKLKLLLLSFILVCTTGCKKDPRIQAAYDLIERVTPGYGNQFKLELMEPVDGMDAYEITSDNGKVVLRHLEVVFRTLAAGCLDLAELTVFACLVFALTVGGKNRCRNEDFFCPFEQFFFGNFGNANVVTSWLKNNHADGLNVIQAFKQV